MELGSRDGTGERGRSWERGCSWGARMVQGSEDGAVEKGWSWGAGMELWNKDGAGKQESCCGKSTWLSPMWPGFNSWHQCHNDLLVVFFVARGFSAGTLVFPFFKH